MIRWYIIFRDGYVPFSHKPQWINCLLLQRLRRVSAAVQTVYFLSMYTGYDRAAIVLFEVYSVGTRLESQLSHRVFPCFSPSVMPVRINTIWIGHILRRNCLLQQVIEGKIKGQIEVTRRRGRRRKKLLDVFKERTTHSTTRVVLCVGDLVLLGLSSIRVAGLSTRVVLKPATRILLKPNSTKSPTHSETRTKRPMW